MARPGFNDRAAHGGVDQTYGDIDAFVEFTSEVITDGREVPDGLRRTGLPLADGVVLRIDGGLVRNGKSRMLGWFAALISASPSAKPLTDHSMLDWPEQSQTSPTRMSVRRIVSSPALTVIVSGPFDAFEGRQGEAPAPFRVRAGAGGVRANLNGDRAAGRGPAPNRQGLVALEDHVVGEDACRSECGLRLSGVQAMACSAAK